MYARQIERTFNKQAASSSPQLATDGVHCTDVQQMLSIYLLAVHAGIVAAGGGWLILEVPRRVLYLMDNETHEYMTFTRSKSPRGAVMYNNESA